MVTFLIITLLTTFLTVAFTAKYRLDIVNLKEERLQEQEAYNAEIMTLHNKLFTTEEELERYKGAYHAGQH